MLQIIKPGSKFDFIKYTRQFAFISSLIAILSIAVMFTKGFNFGIDFAGGSLIHVKFERSISLEDIRSSITPVVNSEFTLQNFGEQNEALIRVVESDTNLRALSEAITGALNESFADNTPTIMRVEQVGPQVGSQLRVKAFQAVLYSVIGILIYVAIRFEFMFGIGAIISLLHDIIITMGIYCFTGKEFNLTVMAAVLTVAGYSLNDTIVIYDRIREKVRNGFLDNMSWKELVNASINETLSRTILTSMLTAIAVVCLYIFGGEVINGFAFMMLMGIIVGTYSSIAIASAFICFIRTRKPKKAVKGRAAA
jgi:preprotein translocase subunit SecF